MENKSETLNVDLIEEQKSQAAHSYGFDDPKWRFDDMLIARPRHQINRV